MMINIAKIGSQEKGFTLSGSYNGIQFGVTYDESKYQKMLELAEKANTVETVDELNAIFEEFQPLTVESYKELVESKTPFLMVNKISNKFFLKFQDVVSSFPVPGALTDRIIESIDKGIDIMPLIKCWVRFLRNPFATLDKAHRFANYINKTYVNQAFAAKLMTEQGVSHDVAIQMATTMQTPITQEGLLCTYKVSEEVNWKWILDADGNKVQKPRYEAEIDDITGAVTYKTPATVEERIFQPAVQKDRNDAFYCGDKLGHIIKVGQWHRLESWDQVDTNDHTSCVKGLHVGNLDYIRGYQKDGTLTHNTFVDPMDIGAITDDGSGALRVLRYFTYSSFAGVNKSIYHSSKVAEITDAEYDKMIQKAVEDTKGKVDKATTDLTEKEALKF